MKQYISVFYMKLKCVLTKVKVEHVEDDDPR